MNVSREKIPPKGKKKLDLAWIGLGLLLIFLLSRALTTAVIGLTKPRVGEACRIYPSHPEFSRLNLLVDVDPVTVASLDFAEREVTLLVLPQELPLILNKNESSHHLCSEVTMAKEASFRLGLPIDGYLLLNTEAGKSLTPEKILTFRSRSWVLQPLRLITALRQVKTDLAVVDLGHLWWWFRGVHSNQVDLMSFKTNPFFNKDKGEWYEEAVDQIISSQLVDVLVRKENIRVGIINGSEVSGAAGQLGRVVTNLGAQLVAAENLSPAKCQALHLDCSEKIFDQSSLLVSPRVKTSWTTKRLAFFLERSFLVKDDLPPIADVFIVVGQKEAKKCCSTGD